MVSIILKRLVIWCLVKCIGIVKKELFTFFGVLEDMCERVETKD